MTTPDEFRKKFIETEAQEEDEEIINSQVKSRRTKRSSAKRTSDDDDSKDNHKPYDNGDDDNDDYDDDDDDDDDDDEENEEDAGFIVHDEEEEEEEETEEVGEKYQKSKQFRLTRKDWELSEEDLNIVESANAGQLPRKKVKWQGALNEEIENDEFPSFAEEQQGTTSTNEEAIAELTRATGTAAARGLFADDDDDYVDSQHLDQPLSQQEKDQTKQNQPQSATQGHTFNHDEIQQDEDDRSSYDDESDDEVVDTESGYVDYQSQILAEREKLNLEPIELEEAHLTEADIAIRAFDLPERIQVKFGNQFVRRDDKFLDAETEWIFTTLYYSNFPNGRRITEWTEPVLTQMFDGRRDAHVMKIAIRNVLSQLNYDDAGALDEEQGENEHVQDFENGGYLNYASSRSGAGPREVPFIAQHRKELAMYPYILNMHDLWLIQEYDFRFCQHYSRKEALLNQLDSFEKEFGLSNSRARLLTDVEKKFICEAQSAESINDCTDFLALISRHQLDVDDNQRRLRRRLNDHYHVCERNHITDFLNNFSITATKVALILETNQSILMEPPSKPPIETAVEFICRSFPTEQKVLDAAQHCLALEIAKHPVIRFHWRERVFEQIFDNRGVYISSHATKTGFKTVEPWDRYASFLFLKRKPVFTMQDDLFLWLEQAARERKIELNVFIDEFLLDDFRSLISNKCYVDPPSTINKLWKKQFDKVLESAVYMLSKSFLEEIQMKLREEAKVYVLSYCANFVRNIVSRQPTECADPQQVANITALVLAPAGTSSYLVVIDPDGDVLDHLQLDWLHARLSRHQSHKFRNDLYKIQEFVNKYKPFVMALGADSVEAKYLQGALITKFQDESASYPFLNVELVPCDIARVYAGSQPCSREFPRFSTELRMSISLARRMQNPEAEIAQLFGPRRDILCIQMHPLQKTIPQAELFEWLYREVMVAINRSCVKINRAVSRPHLAQSLEFVCGLGPRKADKLLSHIRAHRCGRLTNRKELTSILQPCVAYNAASFIIVDIEELGNDPEDLYDDQAIRANLLDMTRIHPDRYTVAVKIAMDAIGSGSVFTSADTTTKHAQEAVLQMRGMENSLTSESLTQFARKLRERDGSDLTITVKDIHNELLEPLRDQRHEFKPIEAFGSTANKSFSSSFEDDVKAFYYLTQHAILHTGEVKVFSHNRPAELYFYEWLPLDHTVFRGQLLDAEVVRHDFRDGRVILRCTNDLPGFMYSYDISDNPSGNVMELVPPGQMITARILKIDVSRLRLRLGSKKSILDKKFNYPRDRFYDFSAEERFQNEMKPEKTKRSTYVKRMVSHPRFANVTNQQAIELLANLPEGTGLFRPSSRGPTYITLSWKVVDTVIAYVLIEEDPEYKTTPESLSSRLTIKVAGEKMEFEDLDEIISEYINPTFQYVQQITKQPKYFINASPDVVSSELKHRKERDPGKIPYIFSPHKDNGSCFWLSFLPGANVYKWHLYVIPTGYIMDNQKFTNLNSLVSSFKRNFQKFIALSKSRDAQEARQQSSNAAQKESESTDTLSSNTQLTGSHNPPPVYLTPSRSGRSDDYLAARQGRFTARHEDEWQDGVDMDIDEDDGADELHIQFHHDSRRI